MPNIIKLQKSYALGVRDHISNIGKLGFHASGGTTWVTRGYVNTHRNLLSKSNTGQKNFPWSWERQKCQD